MTRRVALFLLAASSTEGLALGLSFGAACLGLNADFVGPGAVVGGLVIVTSLLWVAAKPAAGLRRVLGAFAIPVLAVVAGAPFGAAPVFALRIAPDARTWIAALCAGGATAGAALLWRRLPGWRLLVIALLGTCGLLELAVPFPVIIISDPMGGVALSLSRDFAAGIGLLCALATGLWAAAMHPVANPPSAHRREADARW
jgi:hypothetical protein